MRAGLILVWLALVATPAAAQDPIDRLFLDYLAREHIPGAMLVVMRGDEQVLQRRWRNPGATTTSPPGSDAVQPIYSISKQFTAALILRLVDRGLVDLDAPVGTYLPAFA